MKSFATANTSNRLGKEEQGDDKDTDEAHSALITDNYGLRGESEALARQNTKRNTVIDDDGLRSTGSYYLYRISWNIIISRGSYSVRCI